MLIGFGLFFNHNVKIGNKAASVLPVPVGDINNVFNPDKMGDTLCSCMSVSSLIPSLHKADRTRGSIASKILDPLVLFSIIFPYR